MSQTNHNGLGDRDDFEPLDLLQLRAQARALLNNPDRLPVLWVQYMEAARDAQGRVIGEPFCAARFAKVKISGFQDRYYARGEHESVAAFRARIVSELPVRDERRELWADRGGPGLGCMCVSLSPKPFDAAPSS